MGARIVLDDFFVRAVLAGTGLALAAGPLGCFIVWRRLAYFGDSLAHAALLGVAFGLLANINMTLAVLMVCIAVSVFLLILQARANISADAILGIFSHGALALGLVALALMTWVRVDLLGLLFGDILAVSKMDVLLTYAGGGGVLILLLCWWRPLFAATVSRDLAEAEGLNPARYDLLFTFLTAAVIALSIKIVGALLITALLIIPAATARGFARTPESMAVWASLIGVLAVVSGLFSSLAWDTPSGPSIVVACVVFFAISQLPLGKLISSTALRKRGEIP